MFLQTFASRVQQVAVLAAALLGTAAQAAITVTPSATSAGMVSLTLNSSTAGTGSVVLLQAGSCGSPAQTQAGLDGSATAAYRKGSLTLAAGTDGHYTFRNLVQSQSYTVCVTNGTDTGSATFSTPAMAAFGAPSWQTVGSAGFSAGWAYYPSLAFAPDGTPYVAYQDDGNSQKATVMRYDGSSWVTVGSAGFSAGPAGFPSLAFAPDGTPYVAYLDNGNSGKTTVMRYDGSSWVTVGSAGFSAGPAAYQSLAFAPDGTPYVAYLDNGNGGKTTVMRYNGSNWVTVGSAGFSTGSASDQSLAFAPDGSPYVAYQDGGNGLKTTVMRYDGSSWVTVGSAGFSAGSASDQSLAFAPDGTPYVAYQDGGNGLKTTVMRYDGSSWVTVASAGFSAGDVYHPSLAFAPDGTPYVAYQDGGNSLKTTVMRYDGSNWVTVGSAGFSAGDSGYQSLAFAPDGTPYVAYQDGGTSYRTTVMRLTGTAAAPSGLTATPGNGSVTLSWTAPASNGGSAITGYTVTGAPAGSCTTTGALTCTISGLTNGTPHTFTVTATNGAGTGAASASASATPQAWNQPAVPLPGGGNAAVQVVAPSGCTVSGAQIGTTVPAGAPAGASFPLGVFSFTAAGAGCTNATLSVRIDYPAGSLSGLQPYKYGPATAGAAASWFPHGSVVGDSVTFNVTDNGAGDNDTQLGAIADPFGPMLLPVAPAGVASIPTLSEWGMIVLSLLAAMVGMGSLRRRGMV